MPDLLFLSASTDAVDAALMTKEHAVTNFAAKEGVPLSKVAGIGESVNDLPFLQIPGLGMRGAPLNAQPAVRTALAQLDRSVLLSVSFSDAFFEFYRLAEQRGISYVFADKDGVLVWSDSEASSQMTALSAVFRNMGTGKFPFVFVLTGSSYDQNLDFIGSYRALGAFEKNPQVKERPFVVLAENGAVQVNVLTGEIREDTFLIDRSLLNFIKGDFLKQIVIVMEAKVLSRFNLQWSLSAADQIERIWIPPKRTMVTINIPKTFKDGRDYRSSPRGKELSSSILDSMIRVAEMLGIRYWLL